MSGLLWVMVVIIIINIIIIFVIIIIIIVFIIHSVRCIRENSIKKFENIKVDLKCTGWRGWININDS